MPELPEVETISRQLNEVLVGRTVRNVEVLREKSFAEGSEQLAGKTIEKVWRIAKMIVVDFEISKRRHHPGSQTYDTPEEPLHLMVHLKMTGQLIFQLPDSNNQSADRVVGGHPTPDWVNELPSTHTRVVIRFEDGSVLYFNDMRVFGWMKLVTDDQLEEIREKLPPDVVDDEFTPEYLREVLKRSTRAVKLVLLDQAKMGGLGNIYVNDALWRARARPARRANRVTQKQVIRIHEASVEVINRGIELGGASDSDYVQVDGMGGSYQKEFLVYGREGEDCLREDCDGVIKKVKMGGRGTYYCPICQK